MERELVKIGNSTGLTIPEKWLSEMNLSPGSKVSLVRERGGIAVKLLTEKPNPNIKDLMDNTDFEAQRQDPQLQIWGNKRKKGRENT
ncbi:hypothetical protein BCT76_16270 [Vibrio tasmaniensis]|uniref:AbrB/MazE/SpoVT family DNA-binding domain-containing protein n=1 Tax=Vibrio tasmaniensis TaxID=212663 RepID=UPI000C8593B1|nr:AbrB/MazE/SpoVT family DNA-binding domain-containing protein [Vibrio tasmaniensis]PML45811.1 hypothetical protein BCT76_16270 [Vibrio tasmaniensis]